VAKEESTDGERSPHPASARSTPPNIARRRGNRQTFTRLTSG